jgi:hypothetical protein
MNKHNLAEFIPWCFGTFSNKPLNSPFNIGRFTQKQLHVSVTTGYHRAIIKYLNEGNMYKFSIMI